MATLNFNARNVNPSMALEPIPAGWYVAAIVESDIKKTQNGQGTLLMLTFQVLEGDYKGRKIWGRINRENPNAECVRIGDENLSAVCHAVQVFELSDTNQLHNLPLEIKVTFRPAGTDPVTRKSYDASNDINGYRAYDANRAAPPRAGTPPAAPARPMPPPRQAAPARPAPPRQSPADPNPRPQAPARPPRNVTPPPAPTPAPEPEVTDEQAPWDGDATDQVAEEQAQASAPPAPEQGATPTRPARPWARKGAA